VHPNAESLVHEYIAGWRRHDRAHIGAVIAESCTVIESDGATYSGREAILQWMDRWISSGSKVEAWDITNLVADASAACAEWQFTCVCCGNRTSFAGASVFQMSNGKIVSVVEYRREGLPNQLLRPTEPGIQGR